jgi:D-alanyl-D-alanine dipeptidase
MTKAGFINYPKEYWHYSYGDVMWAELTGSTTAIYGIKTLD